MLMIPDLYTQFPEDPTSSVYVASLPLDRVRVHCTRQGDDSFSPVVFVDHTLFRIERTSSNV